MESGRHDTKPPKHAVAAVNAVIYECNAPRLVDTPVLWHCNCACDSVAYYSVAYATLP